MKWQEMQPVPDWGRCPECNSPLVKLTHIYPPEYYCARSGHQTNPGRTESLCGRRQSVFEPMHQSMIQAARRAYFDAMRSLEANRPTDVQP